MPEPTEKLVSQAFKPRRAFLRRDAAGGLLLMGILVWVLGGCATNRYDPPRSGTVMRGIASWYGKDFHGKPTASGVIYDMHGLTAAHRELPLGTIVDVRNLENGRTVRLEINDRGPFIKGRILDLSYGAARELDVVRAGLAKVEIRVVKLGAGRAGPTLTSRYTVQLGAFRDRDNALALRQQLAGRYPEVAISSDAGWHRVRIGSFRRQRDADKLRRELRRHGFRGVVVALR